MLSDKTNAYMVLIRKQERNGWLSRRGHRWNNNVKMDLKERGQSGLIWLRGGTGGRIL
jgi:hypothetical protein